MNKKYETKTKKNFKNRGKFLLSLEKIREAFDNDNMGLARKILNSVDEDYQEDSEYNALKARLFMLENRFEEALEIYNKMREESIYGYKTMLLILNDEYDKVMEMFNKYYLDPYQVVDDLYMYTFIKYAALSYLGLPLFCDFDELKYGTKQTYAYSKERAIDHIKNRHFYKNEIEEFEIDGKNSFFNEEIDIDTLFYNIQDLIDENYNMRSYRNGVYFYSIFYPNVCSDSNGKKYNYITVVASLFNNQILTMYPTYYENFSSIKFVNKEDKVKVKK